MEPDRTGSRWVIERGATIPADALILDLAGGTGRHAEPIARGGRTVVVTDYIHRAVAAAAARYERILGVHAYPSQRRTWAAGRVEACHSGRPDLPGHTDRATG